MIYNDKYLQDMAGILDVSVDKLSKASHQLEAEGIFLWNDLKAAKRLPSQPSKKELNALAKKARELAERLEDPKIARTISQAAGDDAKFMAAIYVVIDVEQWAKKAAEQVKIAYHKGRPSESHIDDWISGMAQIYKQITGKPPRVTRGDAERGGPFVRFLVVAAKPLPQAKHWGGANALAGRFDRIRKRRKGP